MPPGRERGEEVKMHDKNEKATYLYEIVPKFLYLTMNLVPEFGCRSLCCTRTPSIRRSAITSTAAIDNSYKGVTPGRQYG